MLLKKILTSGGVWRRVARVCEALCPCSPSPGCEGFLLYASITSVTPVFRIILKVFLSRSLDELYEMRDGRFDLSITGQGVLIGSTVNGSSFNFGIGTALSALDVQMYAQTAIEYKEAGICAPVTRTTARFV